MKFPLATTTFREKSIPQGQITDLVIMRPIRVTNVVINSGPVTMKTRAVDAGSTPEGHGLSDSTGTMKGQVWKHCPEGLYYVFNA